MSEHYISKCKASTDYYCPEHIPNGISHIQGSQTIAACCICGRTGKGRVLLSYGEGGWPIDHAAIKAKAVSEYKAKHPEPQKKKEA